MSTSDSVKLLADVVAELEREVWTITPKATREVTTPQAKTTLSLILANYSEVLLILARIVGIEKRVKKRGRESFLTLRKSNSLG